MIRFSPFDHQMLEQAQTLNFLTAGAESNVAITLSRLGVSTAWISKLVINALGRKIAQSIQAHGVDTSQVIWTDQGRVGLYFIEPGARPRPTQIIYDRRDSAMSRLTPEEINWECLRGAKLMHLTGITAALSQTCAAVVARAISEARSRKIPVSFDLNYRAKLWSPEEARAGLEPILPAVDVLIAARRDIELLLGLQGPVEDVMRRLQKKYKNKIVLTIGDQGAWACDGALWYDEAYPVEQIDPIGAGDAFAAGFLYGYLQNDLRRGLAYGNALAALKYTMPGDIPYVSGKDVEELIQGNRPAIRR